MNKMSFKPFHLEINVLCYFIADQWQATTSFPTSGRDGDRAPVSEVGGESVTTLPPWPLIFISNDQDEQELIVMLRMLYILLSRILITNTNLYLYLQKLLFIITTTKFL